MNLRLTSGYKFETLSTLPKSYDASTRDEIEKRSEEVVNNKVQYCAVIKTGIGEVKSIVLGGEVDCVWDRKPSDGEDPLPHYLELKTAKEIKSSRDLQNFHTKLMKAWAQCFL